MAAAVHPSTFPDAGHRGSEKEPDSLFDSEVYRTTFEEQTGVTFEDFNTAYVERLQSRTDANGVVTDLKGVGCLADGADTSRDVVILRLRLMAWMTKNKLPQEKQANVIAALKEEVSAINNPNSKHYDANLTIPDLVVEEVLSFADGKRKLTVDNYDAGNQPGEWIKRKTTDIARDDRGETEDEVHIEGRGEEGMDVDSPPDFVADICNQNGATSLLQAVFEEPTNKSKIEAFSSAIDRDIQKAASERKLTTDFTLSPGMVRSVFMGYVRAGILAKYHPNTRTQERSLEQQRACKDMWDGEVVKSGYPPEWRELFMKIGDEKVQTNTPYSLADIERAVTEHKGPMTMSSVIYEKTTAMQKRLRELGEAAEQANAKDKTPPQRSNDRAGTTNSNAKETTKVSDEIPKSTAKSVPADRPTFGSFASPPGTVTYLGKERKIEGAFVSAWSVKPTKEAPDGIPRSSQFLVPVTADDDAYPIWHLIGTRGYGSNAVKDYTAAGGQIVVKGTSDDIGNLSLEHFKPLGIAAVPSKHNPYPIRNSNMMIKGCFKNESDEDKPEEVKYYFRTTLGNKFGQKKIDDEIVKWYAKASIPCPLITKEERAENRKIWKCPQSRDGIPVAEESEDEVELDRNDGKYTSDDGFVQPDHEAETNVAGKAKEPVDKPKTGSSEPKQDVQPQLDIPTGLMDTKQLQWLLEQLKASTELPKRAT